MGRSVRGITSIALVIAAAIAGCSRTHQRDEDGGATDAPTAADAPVDAPADARVAPGRCDLPISSWARAEVALEGAWSAVLSARDGTETALMAVDGSGAHVLRFDATTMVPEILSDRLLADSAGEIPLAFALDRFRVATAVPSGRVRVHDALGGEVASSEAPMLEPFVVAAMAIRDVRIGLVGGGPRGATWAEVHDVAGGGAIVHEDLPPGSGDIGIGIGRGLFTVVAREGGGPSYFYGLDELGLVRAASLDATWNGATFDGSILVGVVVETTTLRFPGGRLEERGMPPDYGAFGGMTVADGPHGTIVGAAADARVVLSIPSGEWLELGTTASAYRTFADQGPLRVGAFFLDGETLRWAGLSCVP